MGGCKGGMLMHTLLSCKVMYGRIYYLMVLTFTNGLSGGSRNVESGVQKCALGIYTYLPRQL